MRPETKVMLVSVAGTAATGTVGAFVHDARTALLLLIVAAASIAAITVTAVWAMRRYRH